VLRDVLCKRDVAIGGQSYALATAAGASVYVLLRQLVVRGWYLPLFSRILASFGVVLAERVYVWHEDATDRLLPPWPRAIVDACRDADDDGAVRRRPTPSDPL